MTGNTLSIAGLFENFTGRKPDSVEELTGSGSHRRYFRIISGEHSFIGVEGTDISENKAFCSLSRHFRSKGLNMPEVLAVSPDGMSYIQEDLGNQSLFDILESSRKSGSYSTGHRALLRKTISQLPAIQFACSADWDFSNCYPVKEFDRDSIMFDLHYFKYCFLKTTGVNFNEVLLERDFETFADTLSGPFGNTFMYRDFQSRNVMIKDGEPYFIDFQDGRRGPVYYDLASFVWQARSAFPEDLKKELVGEYLSRLKKIMPVDEAHFYGQLRKFVLFRMLQVLGAYGFRGCFERKKHFLESIPFAMDNLRKLLENNDFDKIPYLCSVLKNMCESKESLQRNGKQFTSESSDGLEVEVMSFSYKKGWPEDLSGNGGGYVFDCRAIHNPGRYPQYRTLTGMDEPVRTFLETNGEVYPFLENVYALMDAHVQRYINRGFTHLMACFGCTGGQHRSVYCAEALAAHIKKKFGVKVRLIHREQGVDRYIE